MAFMTSYDDKCTPAHTVCCLLLCWVLCQGLPVTICLQAQTSGNSSSDPLPSHHSGAGLLFLFDFPFTVCHTVFAYYLRVIVLNPFISFSTITSLREVCVIILSKALASIFCIFGWSVKWNFKKVHKWINDFITGCSSLGIHFSHLSSQGVELNDL